MNDSMLNIKGLTPQDQRQLSVPQLVEHALRRDEGRLTSDGALLVLTGKYTGRSPGDKFIVDDETTHEVVDWGKVNQPFAAERFQPLYDRVTQYLSEKGTYQFDGFVGADAKCRRHIRVVSEYAWHSLFAHQLFIRADDGDDISQSPDFTIIDAANFQGNPVRDGIKSETFIVVDFTRKIVLIGGTEYAGEIKKAAFTILNFLLPAEGVFPMHCSANSGEDEKTALFFGLSGTGKTTLSADPDRELIGDDEHGWSERGIFNFEGGCYAKCIGLTRESEPEIWDAIKFGAVLENVVIDPQTRTPDYRDQSLTENTRVAYPLSFIPNALTLSVGNHPSAVIFLTADAFGVLPPISRLTENQAMYHFLSGYTAKLAGTERGITEPQATFSTCFGAPFMPLPAPRYAEMLGERLRSHNVSCYLVNTGWSGGAYGIGHRIRLDYTRTMIKAVLSGDMENIDTIPDPVFGLGVPIKCPDIPAEILQPKTTWANPDDYDRQADHLAKLFTENFKRFPSAPDAVKSAGPRVK